MKRVRQTLEGFKAVQNIDFHPAREQFEINYRAERPLGEEFRQAVSDVIIFPGVRKVLGDVGGRLNKSP
ncbi:MAG: hypothetical protein CVU89_08915 [Firmicutes bacterium HGW-Firmicutes-14]|nr:MAG: hypothetical protein CVU89_08915 [Firmicutes bacterium HGW-Firmicutes-14]